MSAATAAARLRIASAWNDRRRDGIPHPLKRISNFGVGSVCEGAVWSQQKGLARRSWLLESVSHNCALIVKFARVCDSVCGDSKHVDHLLIARIEELSRARP